MSKTILITGSTDGIGLETAKTLASQGHTVLLHGRNGAKLEAIKSTHASLANANSYRADLSDFSDVQELANKIAQNHKHLDVLINNAGVFKTSNPITSDGLDVRFVVNTLAPYLLTKQLLPLMDGTGRIINLSSAAQAPIDTRAMAGKVKLDAGNAYAQSKLAITIWSREMARELVNGPVVIAVNPGSFLGTNMVKEAYGMDGKDMAIGVDILTRLALDPEFETASGKYFDNDSGRFAQPHPDALKPDTSEQVMKSIDDVISTYTK